jgi:hypothetical protein
VLGLDGVNDRLDRGAAAHLATDWGGDTAHLAADPDAEPLWVIVAAIDPRFRAVVSTTTRSRSRVANARSYAPPIGSPKERHQRLLAHPLAPMRPNSGRWQKLSPPHKNWCLSINSPATSRVGRPGWPAPGVQMPAKRRSRNTKSDFAR